MFPLFYSLTHDAYSVLTVCVSVSRWRPCVTNRTHFTLKNHTHTPSHHNTSTAAAVSGNTQVSLIFTGKSPEKSPQSWSRGGNGVGQVLRLGGSRGQVGTVSQEGAGIRPGILLVPVAIREPDSQNLTDGHSNKEDMISNIHNFKH